MYNCTLKIYISYNIKSLLFKCHYKITERAHQEDLYREYTCVVLAEPPKERPRSKLQPRTKPKEEDTPKAPEKSSSIFGGAKPVDTAAREREIEERLARQKEIEEREKEKETRRYKFLT